MKTYPLEQALRAQKALRDAAGLEREMFLVEAFFGMICDEIDALRAQGRSDAEMAALVGESSSISLTAEEIAEHYALPEERHPR